MATDNRNQPSSQRRPRPDGQNSSSRRPQEQSQSRSSEQRSSSQRSSTQRTSSSNSKGSKPQRKRSKWKIFRNILLVLLLVVGFTLLGAGIGAYLGIIKNAPKLEAISVKPGSYTSIMVSDTTGEEIDRFASDEDRIYVTLDKIPLHMQNAVIAIEDERFREHNGVDFRATARSIYQTVLQGSTQGGSTITQQVIKNHLGYTRNNIVTKLQEQYLAVKFEKDLTEAFGDKQLAKDYILELYLNTIFLGHGLNGVQTGANYYFDKDISEVTIAESTVLATITQNPSYYAPDSHPENNVTRATVCLNYMLEDGYVTDAEYKVAYADLQGPVYEEVKQSRKVVEEKEVNNSYFTDQVISELVKDFEAMGKSEKEAYDLIYRGGITIYATQDLEAQKIVDEAMLNDDLFNKSDYRIQVSFDYGLEDIATGEITHHNKTEVVKTNEQADAFVEKVIAENTTDTTKCIDEGVYKTPQPQASFVLMENGTGRVIALSGGRGEKPGNRSLNRATQSLRQPGSVFKILAAYAPGIDMQKVNASTVFDDVPNATQSGHQFSNWYKEYRGLSTVREGVRDSMNIVTVKTMQYIGVDNAYTYLENFGFTSLAGDADKNLSTALGGITNGVSNLETTAAFATIANSGTYIKPIFYSKVVDHDGNVIIDNTQPVTKQVMSPQAAYITTDMMYDVVYGGGTGRATQLPNNMPVAGKTGTTSDVKDLCFVGYTPYMTAGIFMGYDTPMKMSGSSKEHQKIWQYIMSNIQEQKSLEVKKFKEPDGIVTASVCSESGQLGTDLCSSDPRGSTIYTELFIAGTQPTEGCNVHQEYKVDTTTDQVANPYCPTDKVVSRVGIVRPVPFETDNPANYPADRKYEISTGNTCTLHSATNDGNAVVTPEVPTPDEGDGTETGIDPGTDLSGNDQTNLLPPVINDPNAGGSSGSSNSGGTTTQPVKPPKPPETVPEFNDDL